MSTSRSPGFESRRRRWFGVLFTLVLLTATVINARGEAGQNPPPIPRDDPEQMVRQATTELLEVSRAARSYAKEDPERYYAAVLQVLDQVLDMRFFARGVMANYASARQYKALRTDAERAAFSARVDRFAAALKRVFLVKYSDALLTFEGERIDLAPQPTGVDDPDRASMLQTIYDKGGETYHVQYSLRRNDDGWLVINVIVEDINLGQIYRSQFAEAVEKNRGDVDYVVEHWVEIMNAQSEAGSENQAGTAG